MRFLKIVALFLLSLAATGLALADGGIVTSASGAVSVQVGGGTARALRVGDAVNQGDNIATGANSSVVMRFDDGQIAALSSNSRMTVSTYSYNPATKSGNVLLSLVEGGLRGITGLIGKANPSSVSYMARTATIGIRGTDVSMATTEGEVVVTVEEGLISFTFEGKTITVPAGMGVDARTNQPFQAEAIATILQRLQGQPILDSINGLRGLSAAIAQAAAGVSGALQDSGTATSQTPSATAPATGAGGGTASPPR